MKIGKITRIFLAITTAIVIIFDIIIVLTKGVEATISYQVWLIAKGFPFLPHACGVLMSHFFAPDWLSQEIPILRYVIWIGVSLIILALSITFYPLSIIHPFIMLIIGLSIGLFWAQSEIKKITKV